MNKGMGGGGGKSVRKAGYLLSLMEGSPHRGEKRGRGQQVASGKDLNSLRKTQHVWHEEKADNYLY